MGSETKKARFLSEESRSYRGARRVRDYKKRARRIDRRKQKQQIRVQPEE